MRALESLQAPVDPGSRHAPAGVPVVDNCEGVKVSDSTNSSPRGFQRAKAPDNDQEQTKNASELGASEAVMSVVSSAAKEKNQDKDDKNRAHDSSSREFLIASAEPEASFTSLGRRAPRQ
jgi:hypothetical protein